MNKIVLYENAITTIRDIGQEELQAILNLSDQIKAHLGLPENPVVLASENSLYVNGLICNVCHGNFNLVILPKICETNTTADATKALLDSLLTRILRCAKERLNSVVYFTRNTIVDDQDVFIDALARFFSEALSSAQMQSSIATYESFENKTSHIRGRILLRKQLSEPMTDTKLWCRYRAFSEDNAYNALLLWACRYLSAISTNIATKRLLLDLSRHYQQSSIELSYQLVARLNIPRQFSAYSECFSIAKNLYLGTKGKKESATAADHICGYAISTERAFESVVAYYTKAAAQKLGYSHRSQATIRFAESLLSPYFDYNIVPDDLVFTNTSSLVLDAKYKLVDPMDNKHRRPKREDFYQIVCSCIAHKSHEAVLIYPRTANSQPMSWKLIESINEENYKVSSCFIDIFAAENELKESFEKIIQNTEFHEVNQNGAQIAI